VLGRRGGRGVGGGQRGRCTSSALRLCLQPHPPPRPLPEPPSATHVLHNAFPHAELQLAHGRRVEHRAQRVRRRAAPAARRRRRRERGEPRQRCHLLDAHGRQRRGGGAQAQARRRGRAAPPRRCRPRGRERGGGAAPRNHVAVGGKLLPPRVGLYAARGRGWRGPAPGGPLLQGQLLQAWRGGEQRCKRRLERACACARAPAAAAAAAVAAAVRRQPQRRSRRAARHARDAGRRGRAHRRERRRVDADRAEAVGQRRRPGAAREPRRAPVGGARQRRTDGAQQRVGQAGPAARRWRRRASSLRSMQAAVVGLQARAGASGGRPSARPFSLSLCRTPRALTSPAGSPIRRASGLGRAASWAVTEWDCLCGPGRRSTAPGRARRLLAHPRPGNARAMGARPPARRPPLPLPPPRPRIRTRNRPRWRRGHGVVTGPHLQAGWQAGGGVAAAPPRLQRKARWQAVGRAAGGAVQFDRARSGQAPRK
jgi:hypothetical protein